MHQQWPYVLNTVIFTSLCKDMHSRWFWVYIGPPCRDILRIVLLHNAYEQGDVKRLISRLSSVFICLRCLFSRPCLFPRPAQHLFSGEPMARALLQASPHLFLFFQLRTVHSAFRKKKTRLNYTDFHQPCWPFQTHDSWPCLPHSMNVSLLFYSSLPTSLGCFHVPIS